MSGSTRCRQQLLRHHAVFLRVRRRDDGEQRRVDAVRARGQNAELPAFLAAVDQELARVLEVVAIDDLAQDAFGRDRRAVRGHHQRDFALRHNRDRHLDDRDIASARSRNAVPARACPPDNPPRRRARSTGPARSERLENRLTTIPTCRSRISTSPSRYGPKHQRQQRNTRPRTIRIVADVTANNGNVIVIITPFLIVVAPTARLFAARGRNAFLTGENLGSATCGPRGSPFQLPARLADGLGPGSDLGNGSPRPSPRPRYCSRNLGPPHWPSGRKANLGCFNASTRQINRMRGW